jgi:hypothetical protein
MPLDIFQQGSDDLSKILRRGDGQGEGVADFVGVFNVQVRLPICVQCLKVA